MDCVCCTDASHVGPRQSHRDLVYNVGCRHCAQQGATCSMVQFRFTSRVDPCNTHQVHVPTTSPE